MNILASVATIVMVQCDFHWKCRVFKKKELYNGIQSVG
jgi:hypothetical protein